MTKIRRIVVDYPSDLRLAGLIEESVGNWRVYLQHPVTLYLQGRDGPNPQSAMELCVRAMRDGMEGRGESTSPEAKVTIDELDL